MINNDIGSILLEIPAAWSDNREDPLRMQLGGLVRKQIAVLLPMFLGAWLAVACLIAGDTQTARGQERLTVEGEWEMVSTNTGPWKENIGKKISISRSGNGYEIKYWDGETKAYRGAETQIARSFPEHLCEPGDVHGAGSVLPRSVCDEVAGQQVMINQAFTLSADGLYLTQARDARWVYWDKGHYTHHEIKPKFYTAIFKRIAGPAKAEPRTDRAYQANCKPVDPNRTTPFPPDHEFCPGNLVCMTNFCGGGMGCPYVCCPKGLPYLNHCDCKCYENSDFDCHSYSYCKEKLIR